MLFGACHVMAIPASAHGGSVGGSPELLQLSHDNNTGSCVHGIADLYQIGVVWLLVESLQTQSITPTSLHSKHALSTQDSTA